MSGNRVVPGVVELPPLDEEPTSSEYAPELNELELTEAEIAAGNEEGSR